jgi:hypothetical protein
MINCLKYYKILYSFDFMMFKSYNIIARSFWGN